MHDSSVNQNISGSDDGLVLNQHKASIWSNDGLLSTGLLQTNFNGILIKIKEL